MLLVVPHKGRNTLIACDPATAQCVGQLCGSPSDFGESADLNAPVGLQGPYGCRAMHTRTVAQNRRSCQGKVHHRALHTIPSFDTACERTAIRRSIHRASWLTAGCQRPAAVSEVEANSRDSTRFDSSSGSRLAAVTTAAKRARASMS